MTTTQQPRRPVGAHRSGEPAGGQFTNKTTPTIKNSDVGFNTDVVLEPSDWTKRTARVGRLRTVFTRTVDTDNEHNTVTSIESDRDDRTLILLARKGDPKYWNGNTWAKDHATRRMWCADIAVQMLREGLVDTSYGNGSDGIQTAMTQAAQQTKRSKKWDPHCLTGTVAQIRGLRLLQSMAPAEGWDTKLAGLMLPWRTRDLLWECFSTARRVCEMLPQPPWGDAEPWGQQRTAGHTEHRSGNELFVGENGDLIWKALTETDYNGWSPAKEALCCNGESLSVRQIVAGAVLYDETAQQQLTHGLFAGAERFCWRRVALRTQTLAAFNEALQPYHGDCRWSDEQQARIRGFIDVIEALEP